MKKKSAVVVAVLGALVLLLAAFVILSRNHQEPVMLLYESNAMQFEIVTTQAAQEKGLGGRTEIPDNYGMLFVFKQADRYGFWMKNMLVPIDIIWLADDGTIHGIERNVSPSTYPKGVYYPPVPVHYVLETRANFTTDHNWQKGTRVVLPKLETTYR